nr:unnamed protein product [Callosobruchus chinensis]
MQSREGQFDSSVTRPYLATSSHFLTGVRFVTSHSPTDIQTDSAPLAAGLAYGGIKNSKCYGTSQFVCLKY